VVRGESVKSNLSPLEMPLTGIESVALQALDGAVYWAAILGIYSEVDYAVRAGANNAD
jgi:hypothetical protein